MVSYKRFCSLLLIGAVFFSSSGAIEASEEEVLIRAHIIFASHQDRQKSLHPHLRPFIRELRSIFGYTRYKVIANPIISLPYKRWGRVPLPGRLSLGVRPERCGEGMIWLEVRLMREEDLLLRTRIRIRDGGTILLGGTPYRKGFLIIAITSTILRKNQGYMERKGRWRG